MGSTGRRTTRLATATFAAALVLAACGSSSGGSSTATTAATGAYGATTVGAGDTTTTAAAGDSTPANTGATTVKAKQSAKLGSILADAKGLTLYTLTDASGKAVACTGGCLAAWPPATLPSGTTTPTGPAGVTLGSTSLTGSGTVVTAGGLPLYRFAADKDDGDAYGEGVKSFGGTWHVVKVGS